MPSSGSFVTMYLAELHFGNGRMEIGLLISSLHDCTSGRRQLKTAKQITAIELELARKGREGRSLRWRGKYEIPPMFLKQWSDTLLFSLLLIIRRHSQSQYIRYKGVVLYVFNHIIIHEFLCFDGKII